MNTSKAVKVSVISIIVNMALSLGKFIVGFSGNSTALISDAVHSASDVFSTFIVIIGVVISGKGADREHPYGHERMECIAAVILAAALGATGAGIGYNGIMTIYSGAYNEMKIPSAAALITAVISIIVKELMYQFTKITAKQINSDALMADAWHHRSDALSSVGSFAGIGGAMLGYPIFDSIAAIIICIFILKAAVDIAVDSVNKLVDFGYNIGTEWSYGS
jgi:cation diffusion facilitator family transporter